jgi:BioD-like phosphotransacetylase family protein
VYSADFEWASSERDAVHGLRLKDDADLVLGQDRGEIVGAVVEAPVAVVEAGDQVVRLAPRTRVVLLLMAAIQRHHL